MCVANPPFFYPLVLLRCGHHILRSFSARVPAPLTNILLPLVVLQRTTTAVFHTSDNVALNVLYYSSGPLVRKYLVGRKKLSTRFFEKSRNSAQEIVLEYSHATRN